MIPPQIRRSLELLPKLLAAVRAQTAALERIADVADELLALERRRTPLEEYPEQP